MLQQLGISESAEAVYRILLHEPGMTVAGVARLAELTTGATRLALGLLVELGFVTSVPGSTTTYRPIDPEVAINALVALRRGELEQARAVAVGLRERYYGGSATADGPIEVVKGSAACARQYFQLLAGVQSELLIFDCAPYLSNGPECAEAERQLRHRGVRTRVVYERDSVNARATATELVTGDAMSEDVRVTGRLPTKLFISDAELALAYVGMADDEPVEMLIRRGPLVDALVKLFEQTWALAVSLPEGAMSTTTLPQEHELLLLMASGLKDEAISRHLGVSLRTTRRRISDLLESLGASTRFQAGLQVGRRP